jgi:hypothetical protein
MARTCEIAAWFTTAVSFIKDRIRVVAKSCNSDATKSGVPLVAALDHLASVAVD